MTEPFERITMCCSELVPPPVAPAPVAELRRYKKMELNKRINYFCNNYDLIFYDKNFTIGKIYIGKKNDKKCRFCNKDKTTATFKTRAHAVPEFLGNKKYLSYEECDNCNKYFSEKLEDNLDKFTKPYRTIARIKGKNKIPTYKSKDKKTWLGFESTKKELLLKDVVDSGFINLEFDKKKISMRLKFEQYIPTAVYKCLVKIALSLMSQNELPSFQKTIKWIRHEDHSKKILNPQIVFYKFGSYKFQVGK